MKMFRREEKKFSALWLALPLLVSVASFGAPSGKEIYEETIKATPIFNDPSLIAYINKLGREIVAVSDMSDEEFTFTLLDSPELNAFATADNYVYVNRGLLNYVSNEAQLASVIAHEVAHITCDHVKERFSKGTSNQMLSTLVYILSGSGDAAEAAMAYGQANVRSFGRRQELEADEVGAEYMAKLGYDVNEMLSMLSVMKDFETLQKEQAKSRGAIRPTYHGVFASHPRNDARLRAVVSKASQLSSGASKGNGANQYRKLTQDLVWGKNFLAKKTPPERFSNMRWRIRFDLPEGWTQSAGTAPIAVIGESPETKASISMTRLGRTAQSPEEYLFNQMNVKTINAGEKISPARLNGFTGTLTETDTEDNKTTVRVAVIYYKLHAYIFRGHVKNPDDFTDFDKLFMEAINTFRTISQAEIDGQQPQKIHYIKATSNTTFDGLARHFSLKRSDVSILRVINGLYPAGEPKAGQIIKVFKR
tara:strand:- start:1741 stop:3174 length:1434 start_codon:yes stop_codon:yes gene_type:complete